MKYFFLLLLVFSFPLSHLMAHEQQPHYLASGISDATSDSAKFEIYLKLSIQYLPLDRQKSIMYGQKALLYATANKQPSAKIKAFHALGVAYMANADYNNALQAHTSALRLSAKANDVRGIVQAHIHLGNTCFKATDHRRALEHYQAAATYAAQRNNHQELSQSYTLSGSVHESKGRYLEAIAFYEKAAEAQRALPDKHGLAISLMQIGMVYIQMGQPEKALGYTLEAMQTESGPKADNLRVNIVRNIAEAYKAMYNNSAALKYALQSYEMAAAAAAASEEAVASARLVQAIYADMQDYGQAYKYQAISTEQERILQQKNEEVKLKTLTDAYEAEKKELELLRQQARAEKLLLQAKEKVLAIALTVLAVLAVVSLLLLFFVFRRRMKMVRWELQDTEQQLQARNYKLQLLQTELEQQSLAFQHQSEELERHSNFKNKIFSIISHDLRGPFASVKGVLNLVQNKPMSEAGIKYLFGMLSKDLDVTLNMLNNLLVWSKAQLEHSEITFVPVDMQLLTQENMELAASQAKHKNIEIYNLVGEEVLVLADKERVNFVLRNLLMNALKFTFEGGEIHITAKEIGETITIAVADDGKGVSEEHLSKMFTDQRFTTLGTASEKGTGLGLMLCKEFIESMNGSIGVESKEGIGSMFYFTLPKAEAATSENENSHKLMLA